MEMKGLSVTGKYAYKRQPQPFSEAQEDPLWEMGQLSDSDPSEHCDLPIIFPLEVFINREG